MKLIKIYLLSLMIVFTYANAYAQDQQDTSSQQEAASSSQDQQQLIDPTVRPAGSNDPILKAIAISQHGEFCVIDDRDNLHLLQVNDIFKTFKVLEITKEYVLISNSQNAQIKLSFY